MRSDARPVNGARPPKLSIGFPVRNGQRYLAGALDSLLAQTFADFELIISDNASTDATPEICRAYAGRDARIHYSRLDTNIGGYRNHNRVVGLARGEYFCWAAHDDLRAPEHLARCVEVLDRDPATVICFTAQHRIDERGDRLEDWSYTARVSSPDPRERWADLVLGQWIFDPNFGVMRSAVLRKTGLLAQHGSSDRVLLAELALYGRFHRIEERLYSRRIHSESSYRQCPTYRDFNRWFAPERQGSPGDPRLGMLGNWLRTVRRAPLTPAMRLFCFRVVAQWAIHHPYVMACECSAAVRRLARRAHGRLEPQQAEEAC